MGFKRALARHQEALRAGFAQHKPHALSHSHVSSHHPLHNNHQLLQHQHQQHQQRQHLQQQSEWEGLDGLLCPEDALLQCAMNSVTDAAQSFQGSLTQYFGSDDPHSNSHMTLSPASGTPPGVSRI